MIVFVPLMGLIRLLLAIAVVVTHSGGSLWIFRFFGEGVTAVQSFFILSGFTIALVLRTKYATDTRAFWINRIVRIYPAYWIIIGGLLVVSIAARFATGHFVGGLGNQIAAPENLAAKLFFLIPNLGIVGVDALQLAHLPNESWAPQAWSLSVELTFYFFAPFVLRRRPLTIAAVFVASELLRIVFVRQFEHWTPWSYFFMPAELPFFFGGALAYCVYERLGQSETALRTLTLAGPWALALVCGAIIVGRQLGIFPFESSVYFIIFAAALPSVFAWGKGRIIDHWLGELSFPVYLIQSALSSLWPKARLGAFFPVSREVYVVAGLSIALSFPIVLFERRIRARFKRAPEKGSERSGGLLASATQPVGASNSG